MQYVKSSPKFQKLTRLPLLQPTEHMDAPEVELIEAPPENSHQFTCLHRHFGVKITKQEDLCIVSMLQLPLSNTGKVLEE